MFAWFSPSADCGLSRFLQRSNTKRKHANERIPNNLLYAYQAGNVLTPCVTLDETEISVADEKFEKLASE